MKYTIILLIILVIINIFIRVYLRNKYRSLFYVYLKNKDFKAFDELINKKQIRYIFVPFTIEFLKLNRCFISNNQHLINLQYQTISKMNLTDKQAQDFYMTCFNYFLSKENFEMIEKTLEKIKQLRNEEIKKVALMSYNVFCKNSFEYLDEILNEYQKASNLEKEKLNPLICRMYLNKGDKENAKMYC